VSVGVLCLTCRRYVSAGRIVQLHECRCLAPVPSADGVSPLPYAQAEPYLKEAHARSDALHSPEEDRPAQPDYSRGKWAYPPLVVTLNGEHFEIQADGTVYHRTMRKALVKRSRMSRYGIKEDRELVPGPLVRIPEDDPDGRELAAHVRDAARDLYHERRREGNA
jgi:hypothetical protein